MHIVIDARIRKASTGRPVDRLLEYLQDLDRKNNYTILLAPNDEWRPKNRKFKTATCKYKMFSFNPLQQLTYAWQLYRLKPDLVHFTMTGQQPIFYFGKQITLTHDLTMFDYVRAGKLPVWLHRLRMLGYRFLLWQSHRKAKTILVPTEYVRDALYKRYLFVRRRIVVTLEASEPPIEAKTEPVNGIEQPFILYVGSAFPHKNLERLAEAFEIIVAQKPETQLVFTGKLEYHAEQLKKLTQKLSYADHITFTGFVSDAQLKWLYMNASVYVFPSLSEGFGLPGLEAMAHGCPVVSSNATCLPEVHGDAAQYFNPNDTEDIAQTILRVMNSARLRQKLINEGYKQVKKFSWKRMCEQTKTVYDSVLESS